MSHVCGFNLVEFQVDTDAWSGNFTELSYFLCFLNVRLTVIIEQLSVDIIPFIVLLIVPVLGRMSDHDQSVRLMSTNVFATLIRLLPLEVSNWVFGVIVFLTWLLVPSLWMYCILRQRLCIKPFVKISAY